MGKIVFSAAIFVFVWYTPLVAADESALKTEDQKVLYSLGVALGRNTASFGLTPEDAGFVIMGFSDSLKGEELKADYKIYGPRISQLAVTRQAARAGKEKKKSEAFLRRAAKKKGAQVSKSGLIYTRIKKGKGDSPRVNDTVKVHYHGTLIDGTVFDSSVERNQPASFSLMGVIPCWTEGVQKMKVGEKAELICPSSIAYGDHGSPPRIPGGAALIFEIELLEIVKK